MRRIVIARALVVLLAAGITGTVGAQDLSRPPAKQVSFSIAVGEMDSWNDDVARMVDAQNNTKIKVVPLDADGDTARQQLGLWAASGTLPNFFSSDMAETAIATIYKWYDDGVIRAVPDGIINRYPSVKSSFDRSAFAQGIRKMKGSWLGMPVLIGVNPIFDVDPSSLYYRQDWAKTVGITRAPQTVDELYEMLKRFALNDPDRNGKNDTYGITTQQYPFGMHAYFGINPESWVLEDGRYIPGKLSKKNVEALKFMRRLFQEKILDPEFATNNRNVIMQKFSQNLFGSVYTAADAYWVMRVVQRSYAGANSITPAEAFQRIAIIPWIKAKASDKPLVAPNQSGQSVFVNVKTTDEQIDRFFRLIEWTRKPDVRNIFRYGFPGKENDVVNGEIQLRKDGEGAFLNVRSIYPSSLIMNMADFDSDNHLVDMRWAKECQSAGLTNLQAKLPYVFKENYLIRVTEVKSLEKVPQLADQDSMTEAYTRIITGTDDAAKMFDEYVSGLMKLGAQAVIDEVNAKIAGKT